MGTHGTTVSNFQHLSPASRRTGPQPPYLITRVEFDHISPLSCALSPSELHGLAQAQVRANKLPTYLVFAHDLCLYLSPHGQELLLDETPLSLLVVSGLLASVPCVSGSSEDETRKTEFIDWTSRALEGCTRQAACLGLNGQARAVRDLIQRDFREPLVVFGPHRHKIGEISRDGVHCHRRQRPPGLTQCAVCKEWSGSCAVTQAGSDDRRVVPVLCRCANDNHCAACGALLAERKLGSAYFVEESEALRYYPGYQAFTHRCVDVLRSER